LVIVVPLPIESYSPDSPQFDPHLNGCSDAMMDDLPLAAAGGMPLERRRMSGARNDSRPISPS
jgi:hypothetical protein